METGSAPSGSSAPNDRAGLIFSPEAETISIRCRDRSDSGEDSHGRLDRCRYSSPEGKLAVVTGATGGLGYQTAVRLAQAGAEVVLTGRNEAKGHEAIFENPQPIPCCQNQFRGARSGKSCLGRRFRPRPLSPPCTRSLDLLINNAGVMALPTRQTTGGRFLKCSSEPIISATTR